MNRKYISVSYDTESQKNLTKWALDSGLDLSVGFDVEEQKISDFDFHSTLIYSNEESDLANAEISVERSRVIPAAFGYLGPEKNVPVIMLTAEPLTAIMKHYSTTYGLTNSYPDYKPHISISYSLEPTDITKLKMPTFPIFFDVIRIENVKYK